MSSRSPTPLMYADFFTTTHRISGGLHTGTKPLSDQLNDQSQSYLMVSNVYVSRLNEPGAIGAHAPVAYLSKHRISFVIVPLREARVAEGGRFGAQEYQALVTLPGFEVQGTFAGPRRIDLKSFSPAVLGAFVPLSKATAQSITMAEVVYNGEVILINRDCLESLCIGD